MVSGRPSGPWLRGTIAVIDDRNISAPLTRSDGSRKEKQIIVIPIVSRFGGGAGESPEVDTFVVQPGQVGESSHRFIRLRMQPLAAIQKVLGRVIGRISKKRLGINGQPRLTFRTDHIAGV